MRWTHLMTCATLLSVPLPLAAAAEVAPCAPTSAAYDASFSTGDATYYLRYVEFGAPRAEVWRESNGEPGLQTSAGMSCSGAADAPETSQCLSRYCLAQL